MGMHIELPDLSEARFRRDVGVGRWNAAVAFALGVSVFLLTTRYAGELNVLVFGISYAVIPCCLAVGMLIERNLHVHRLVQASLLVVLAKFVTTIGLHLMRARILEALSR